jgi:hypothetical protein
MVVSSSSVTTSFLNFGRPCVSLSLNQLLSLFFYAVHQPYAESNRLEVLSSRHINLHRVSDREAALHHDTNDFDLRYFFAFFFLLSVFSVRADVSGVIY